MKRNRYYGPDKVMGELLSVDGIDIELTLDTGKQVKIRKVMWEYVASDKPMDLTELRKKRTEPVVQEIMKVMLAYNILIYEPMNEFEFVLSVLKGSHENNIKMAMEQAFETKEENIGFVTIDQILKDAKDL